MDVLDNDILGAIRNAQSLPLNDTRRPNTDDRLVATDIDARDTGLVVRDRDGGSTRAGVAVRAPARLVDGVLAAIAGTGVGGGAAAGLGHAAFGADEVVLLVQDDDAGCGVGEPGLELGDVGGVLGGCAAATGCPFAL